MYFGAPQPLGASAEGEISCRSGRGVCRKRENPVPSAWDAVVYLGCCSCSQLHVQQLQSLLQPTANLKWHLLQLAGVNTLACENPSSSGASSQEPACPCIWVQT